VLWNGTPFEVVAVARTKSTEIWTLAPWPEQEAMRGVIGLDARWLELLANRQREMRREARLRWVLLPLTPLLGLAPAPLQRRWQAEWGFPAALGTGLSALAEIAVGTLGVVQSLAAGFGAGWFLPGFLWWLVVVGPVLFVVGLVRLVSVFGHGEPVGSPLGLPFMALLRRDRMAPTQPPPPSEPDGGRDRARNPIRDAWITALACLAPGDLQEEWAPRMGLRPTWLTLFGAGAEVLGGLVNLGATTAGDLSPWFVADVFFLLEGLARLALLVATRGPVGSLFGILLRPWLERSMESGSRE
jgi:hypothetical protein